VPSGAARKRFPRVRSSYFTVHGCRLLVFSLGTNASPQNAGARGTEILIRCGGWDPNYAPGGQPAGGSSRHWRVSGSVSDFGCRFSVVSCCEPVACSSWLGGVGQRRRVGAALPRGGLASWRWIGERTRCIPGQKQQVSVRPQLRAGHSISDSVSYCNGTIRACTTNRFGAAPIKWKG